VAVQSILTVVLSGVVAALVSFILSSKKETFLYKQKKAEELFLAADKYIKNLSSIYMLWAGHVKGDLSKKDMNELVLKNLEDTSPHATLWMLTRFYFPEVEPTLRAFDKKRAAVNSVFNAHERNAVAYKVYDDVWGEFINASDTLINAIVAQGKKFQEIPVPFAQAFSRPVESKSPSPRP
jgi:hypothetical protein